MPTNMSIVQTFPAPPDQVFALLQDQDWVAESAKATNGPGARVRLHEVVADRLSIVTESPVDPAGLPAGLRPILANGAVGTKTELWRASDDGYSADFEIAIPGTPAKVHALVELVGDPSGSRLTIDATATVKIPVLGSKIEQLVIDQTRERLSAEYRYLHDRLS
jgi:hypothetical protein